MRLERYRLAQDAQSAAHTQGTHTQKWALEHPSLEHTAPPVNLSKSMGWEQSFILLE